MRVKVVEPGKRQIIVSLSSRAYFNNLIAWQVLSELGRDKNLACKDEEGWDNPPCRANALHQSNPLAIARLEFLLFPRLL